MKNIAFKSTSTNIYWFILLEMKPNQQGTSLTKRKTHSKKAENGHKSSLRPGSPHADKSDASDADLNGDAEEDDVSYFSPLHFQPFLYFYISSGFHKKSLTRVRNILK